MSDMANPVLQQRAHPLGESEGSTDAVPAKSEVDTFAGKISRLLGPERASYSPRPGHLLHRVSEDQRAMGKVGRRLPAEVHEPELTQERRDSGHDVTKCAGGPKALRPHHRAPR